MNVETKTESICDDCGHYQLAHRDRGYDADVAGSMPGLGSCTEDDCPCKEFTKDILDHEFLGEPTDA